MKKWTDEYPFNGKSSNVIISVDLWKTIIDEHNRLAELEDKIEQGEFVSKDWHDEQIMHAENEIEEYKSKIENGTLKEEKVCTFDEWQDVTLDSVWQCSNCKEDFCFIEGDAIENMYHYCPNCGAKITEYKELQELQGENI